MCSVGVVLTERLQVLGVYNVSTLLDGLSFSQLPSSHTKTYPTPNNRVLRTDTGGCSVIRALPLLYKFLYIIICLKHIFQILKKYINGL